MKNKAFTLIELLVVVLIIGILAAIALPQYQKVVEKTIAQEGVKTAKVLGGAAERHRLATGDYPRRFEDFDVSYPNFTGGPGNDVMVTLPNKKFIIHIYSGYDNVILDRMGTSSSYRYDIVYCYKDRSLWCGAGAGTGTLERDKSICESLGGVSGTTIPAGCKTYRQVDYKL
jgi:prepilin-type N-terminal cleavage/methylation domain-containing protein